MPFEDFLAVMSLLVLVFILYNTAILMYLFQNTKKIKMGILLFILGAVLGVIEMFIQHPFEDIVEKRFQQLLHTGIYRKLYFKTVNYEALQKTLIKAIKEYNFDYAKIIMKQLEWFIEEKASEEKREAKELANKDYHRDLKNISKFKGNKNSQQYREDKNKWEKIKNKKEIELFGEKHIKALNQGIIKDYFVKYDPNYFFSEVGKNYLQTFNLHPELNNPIDLNINWILYRINAFHPKSVLEVGCGFGRIMGFLIKNNIAPKVVGVEFSKEMIEQSSVYYKTLEIPKEQFPLTIQADVTERLPFEDKSFDVVYTHACLTHIPPSKIKKAIDEISRVAKEGIVLTERYWFAYEHAHPHHWSHELIIPFKEVGWEIYEYTECNEEHHTKLLVLLRKGDERLTNIYVESP